MKKVSLLLAVLAMTLGFGLTGVRAADDPMTCPVFAQTWDAAEVVPLFGKNLENADFPEGVWSMSEAGELTANKDAVIWTKKQYGSFECSFEFKLSPKTNGGFLIQCSNKNDWIPNTIEIQLLDDFGQKPDYHTCGAVYGFQAPTKNTTKKPGEWNKMTVRCIGRTITIWLNGEKINEIDTAQWTDNAKGPAGTDIEEKFHGHSLASTLPYGFIGFQGLHGNAPMTIRNATIKSGWTPNTSDSGWRDLFGDKLQDADCDASVWSVAEGGLLKSNKDDAIWSKEKFTNFVLDLDFRCTEKANSGIVIKASDKKNWIPNSLEIQVANTFGAPSDFSATGSVYGRSPVFFNPIKPANEWNHISVVCADDWVFVCLNGELITIMDKTKFTDKVHNPDGTDAKPWLRERAPADLDNAGWVGLQGLHGKGESVDFRNVKILPF